MATAFWRAVDAARMRQPERRACAGAIAASGRGRFASGKGHADGIPDREDPVAGYGVVVGGQVFPLEIFPGHEVSSSFGDGEIARYVPTLPEFLLGVGGLGATLLLTVVGVRAFDFMPQDDFVSAKS